MTQEANANAAPNATADQPFLQVWVEAVAKTLTQLGGSPVSASALEKDKASGAAEISAENGVWIRMSAGGKLAGELAFFSPNSDAVQLAQMLAGQPRDLAVALTDAHREALQELFQQFGGVAAAACKSLYGSEVSFSPAGLAAPEWKWVIEASSRFQQDETAGLVIHIFLSEELEKSIQSAAQPPRAPVAAAPSAPPLASQTPKATPAVPVESAASEPKPIPVPDNAVTDANLALLLDVELDASLRFGKREMLLHEVLELRPGFVIELDRRLQEPAELLVAGRVIARGEVVIVDGNYSLRITEVVQPQDRLQSLSA